MLRRLRSGKRPARGGYNDVNDQSSHQDEHLNNAAHKQLNNHSTYPASPTRRSAYSQKRTSPSQSKSLHRDYNRNRSDRIGRDHQSLQRQQQRNKTEPVFDASQQLVDSPDDVSRGFTSLTYESSVTGISNASKSRNADNSVSFSTIWEREEGDFEHPSGAFDPTPMQVAEARKSALNIALYDRVTNNSQRNGYHSNPAKQSSATRVESKIKSGHSTAQQPINPESPESRRHDYDYRPSPPHHRKAMNSPKEGHDTIINVRLPSSPEVEKNEASSSPPPSFIASSAQTQNVNNGTTHLITRLLKKHQFQTERVKFNGKKSTMNTLQQTDADPTTTTNVRHQQIEAARKSSGLKPDPASKSSAAVSRRDRPPDPPAEEWKRQIPVKKVSSTHTKNTTSSSKFWDDVENFPAMKGERELRQFFEQNLVRVTKEPLDMERPRRRDHVAQAAVPQRRSEPAQDETDNFSNAFSLNLNVNKQGRFDDSDISALEMFDSATVYHHNAMAGELGDAQNYWKLKYDRLKEETRAALKESKIVEEPEEVDVKQKDQMHKPNSHKELNRVFSGLTVDLDDEGAFCRDGLSQTMNMLMQKVNEYENVGAVQMERRIEDNLNHLVRDPCVEIAEQAMFPAERSQEQRAEQSREQNLTHNKSLADDLTAALSSRMDENHCHIIESEAAEAQCYMPRSTPNVREKKIIPRRKHDHPDSRPTGKKEHSHRQDMNVVTPDKSASSPDNKQPHPDSAATDEVTHPMLSLGSLHQEATTFERVRQSLLRCSDNVMSRFMSSSNSNQLAILNGIDAQKMIRQCHNPHSLGKTLSQTLVHYGKKVIQKREVISELNQNILRFGARHPLVGESHLKVGLLHMYDGHYPDSILHLEEAIKIKTTFLEPNHPDLSSILMFIALNQLALERFDECMSSLLGVRRFREDAVGHTHPEIGLILNNIACVHYELGDSKRAESLFQEALDLQREAFTTEPTFLKSVSTLLSNIAFLHAKNGLFAKALIELEGALQIQQEILCDEDNESDAILENIAHIMAIQKMQHGSGNMEEITNQYMTMLMRR
ncbi:hypothetical protein ACHAWT_000916 [Skeletonema menzelii]